MLLFKAIRIKNVLIILVFILRKGKDMKITEDVHIFESMKGKGAYAYVILDNEITLIDTGLPGSWKKIKRGLAEIGIRLDQVKHILITHHDIDHVGSAVKLQELTRAKLWASKEDIDVINGDVDREGFKKYFKYIFRIKKPKDIEPLRPGQRINNIKVIPTPGHTPGHLCFLYKDVLFAGDLLKNKKGVLIPYPKRWNWNNTLMTQSVINISRIPFKFVCPGHGKPIDKGSLLDRYIE